MQNSSYKKALDLLYKASSDDGFLASAVVHSNYKRVWARDGVICGLAALASGDAQLIATFERTLAILARNQHKTGTIPSNVLVTQNHEEVSYGGLAGRVDAVTWFIIGVCQYAFYMKDDSFLAKYKNHIALCLKLMDAWEFNNKHLMYVPLSGNWADEFITDGYVLYDQLLRVWALKNYNYFEKSSEIEHKIQNITSQIEVNFMPESGGEKYHDKGYSEFDFKHFMPCSFSPAGYKTYFDAFANALALLLNLGSADFQSKILWHCNALTAQMDLKLIPAFWPPIYPKDPDWHLLKNNCKYEFRNFPNTFHNGGVWPMVNGFYGIALVSKDQKNEAIAILEAMDIANKEAEYHFYENYNSLNGAPNGVPSCAWSAAAAILLEKYIFTDFKLLL